MQFKKIFVAVALLISSVLFLQKDAAAHTTKQTQWVPRSVAQIKADLYTHTNGISSYTVKWGDTLYAISLAVDISMDQLAQVNNIENIRLIEVDTILYFNEDKSIISIAANNKVDSYNVTSRQKVATPQTNKAQIEKDALHQSKVITIDEQKNNVQNHDVRKRDEHSQTRSHNTTMVKEETTQPVTQQTAKNVSQPVSSQSPHLYSLNQFMFKGVIRWNGLKFTYYSQSVLPGGGLKIPGRHVNASGYVADKDGYIVLASSQPMGTIIDTPFGYKGKVYDRGTVGNHYDVYIR